MNNTTEQIIDELLVMECQAGKTEAFDLLVSRRLKRLCHHAYRLAGDAEAAWDITQQSWIGIIKGLRKLRDPSNFRAWAYRITTNKSIDWIKRDEAEKNINIVEVQGHQDDWRKDIEVEELPGKPDIRKRDVLYLYYFEQLSVSETGIVLKIPDVAVKSLLANARKELKEPWQKYL